MSDLRWLRFTIPGPPRGKGRPRAAKRGAFIKLYTDDRTAAYENLVALAAQQALAGDQPLDGPVMMSINCYHPIPKTTPKKHIDPMCAGIILPTKKPDLDNVVKAVLDGCNGVAFHDDVQVVFLAASKFYAVEPRVEVKIEQATQQP